MAVLLTTVVPAAWAHGAVLDPALQEKLEAAVGDERIPVTIALDAGSERPPTAADPSGSKGRLSPDERQEMISRRRARAQKNARGLLEWLARDRKGLDPAGVEVYWIVDAVTAELPASTIEALRFHPDVTSVHLRESQQVLSSPKWSRSAEDYGPTTWAVSMVGADSVWHAYGMDGTGVLVAMLDTGVDYTPSDLSGRMWTNPGEIPGNSIDDDGNGYVDDYYGFDFALDQGDPMDDHGHGTHTAGTVAGDGTGGRVTGVAPGAQIMALKVLDYGSGLEEDVWEAIQYAVEEGCDVINMSIGWIQCRYHPDRALWRQACENALSAGVVVCAAAGNERNKIGTSVYCDPPEQIRTPADVPGVIAVGAVTSLDVVTAFSCQGPVTWESVIGYEDYPHPPGLVKPDLCAPGQDINSTILGGGYSGPTWDGTSMATPHVSGAAALLLQADSTLTPAEVAEYLRSTAVELGPEGKDNLYGNGRIDVLAAVGTLLSDQGPPADPTAVRDDAWAATAASLSCHPNPFNPDARLSLLVAETGCVLLEIYDARGRRVRTLCDEVLAAGEQRFVWDGRDHDGNEVASGLYFCRFQSPREILRQKLILAK